MKSYNISKNEGHAEENDFIAVVSVIRRFAFLVIIIFLLIFLFSLYEFTVRTHYSSTATFIVNNWNENVLKDNPGKTGFNENNDWMAFFYSDSAIDFLISKYEDADKTAAQDTFELAQLHKKIVSAISIQPTFYNSYDLTVTTTNCRLSADIANDLIEKVRQLNDERHKEDLKNKISFLENLMVRSSESQLKGKDNFQDRIQEAVILINTLGRNEDNRIRKAQEQLLAIMNDMRSAYTSVSQEKQYFEVALNILRAEPFPSITVTRKALPDYHSSVFRNLFYSIFIGFISVLSLLLVLYAYKKFQRELTIVSEKPEDVNQGLQKISP